MGHMERDAKNPHRGARQAPPEVQRAVRKVLERDGERAACKKFGLSRLAVTKIATGRPVYPGTVALATARMDAGDDE